MKWSVRDESLHSRMGCKLFRDMCAENNQLLHLCEKDIISAAETMVKLESNYIDKMFNK
jgi:ribonucleoside-diphosphate reductase beta chain